MKLKFLTILLLIPATLSNATYKCPTKKIAIVDTGLDLKDPRFTHLCESGHKNFVAGETINDVNSHGTSVTSLIEEYAGKGNYCLLIYKYYKESSSPFVNLNRELLAFQEAVDSGATIINFSSGGKEFNEDESLIIKNNPHITFVVAAGNEGENLDIPGNEYYPASYFYKNMEVVGGIDNNGNRVSSSNYSSKIKDKELGENVLSSLPNGKVDYRNGTSFATAIFTGKLVAKSLKSCEYR